MTKAIQVTSLYGFLINLMGKHQMTDKDISRKEKNRLAAERKRRRNGIKQVKGTIKKCCDCGKEFVRNSVWSVRCKQCQSNFALEKAREVSRQKCAERGARKKGSIDKCHNCGVDYIVTNGKSKYCVDCKILQKKNALPFMKEHAKKYKKQYSNNPENRAKINKTASIKNKRRRLNDPLYQCIDRIRARINQVFRLNGYTKRSRTYEILGCSYEFLMGYIESKFQPGMSWENRSEWHIDHIIPLASAKTEEDVIRLNHYKNLRPLWAEDNLRKSDKMDYQPCKS